MGVDVHSPKPLDTHPGDELLAWARGQLAIARSILDNPGGGLLFATQTMGQVRSALHERDAERWKEIVLTLDGAEAAAVHRDFATSRRLLDETSSRLR
jgi:hypothetical protein